MRTVRSRAFTFTDLLIALVMLLMVGASIVPSLMMATRYSSNRISCSSNLRVIGLAMKMYANEEPRTNSFPRTIYVPDAPPTAYNQPDLAHPFKAPGMAPNDVTAALWLLLRTQDITQEVFICPSSDAKPRDLNGTTADASNFARQTELSYSVSNPYPSTAAVKDGYLWADPLPASFPLLADMNPGHQDILSSNWQSPAATVRNNNSPNHEFDGQNVLYADGHVDWVSSPFGGTSGDHIFAVSSVKGGLLNVQSIVGSPVDATDSVMLPAWDPAVAYPIGLDAKEKQRTVFTVAMLLGALVVAAVIALIVWLIKRSGSRRLPRAISKEIAEQQTGRPE